MKSLTRAGDYMIVGASTTAGVMHGSGPMLEAGM